MYIFIYLYIIYNIPFQKLFKIIRRILNIDFYKPKLMRKPLSFEPQLNNLIKFKSRTKFERSENLNLK